jgi:hypothetical protein
MLALLLSALLAQAKAPDRPLQGPAAKCGTEIPWTASLAEAQRLAKETGRPIAWWVPTLDGSPMDRKLVVEKHMLAGPFMMPGVVELLSERFVPLRLPGERAHRERFGLAPLDFIEPGLLFLDAELKPIHRVDRISTFSEDWFVGLLNGVLRKAGKEEAKPKPPSAARKLLLEGALDPALYPEGDEGTWSRGVALHWAGRDEEGRAEWRKLKEGRWAWKAAAELARDGPFVRGFEVHEALPADALRGLPGTSTLPRAEADVRRAVRFLLRTQRAGGAWDDSNYNFGGDDSLPNVHLAVTALAALALRAHAEGDEAKQALARAERYLRDETKVAAGDMDEIAWAYAYRLLYFAETKDAKTMAVLVRRLGELQHKEGIWYHEYENPFVTATVLHALDAAKKAGAEVPDGTVRRGLAALQTCRDRKGVWSYSYPGRGGELKGAAGRLPLCELALLLHGKATAGSVGAALDLSFQHHELLERVRKYDDHADGWKNGGFFFWYDQHGRALAARAVGSADALRRQREIVLATQEIDGCWVDSHELGRVYGTAMALLTLKLCAP